MGSLFEHLVGPEETDGELGVALVTQPPGIATPLHRHSDEAEAFYVLDGGMTTSPGGDLQLDAGWFIYLPRGVPHAFRIRGDAPARILALTAPGGLLGLYDEVGVPAAGRRLPGGTADARGGDRALERGRPALRPRGRRPADPGATCGWST